MADYVALFMASGLRLAMPMVFAATGELVSERAGVLNLSLEGMMLTGAFFGAWGSWSTQQPLVGLLIGVLAALVVALVQAWLSVSLGANQLVVGIGFNILILGATTLLYREVFGALSRDAIPGFGQWHVPLLSRLPLLGVAMFKQTGLVYVGVGLLLATWLALDQTAWGLAIKAAGEEPRAADQAGVGVQRIRYGAVLFAGGMAGLGGVFISLGDIHTFTENMTNGAGYLAITAVIFGAWRPGKTFLACLLFGAATALQFQLPALGVNVPTSLLLMLPYVLALLAVVGAVGRTDPPAALALPYRRS
jgi:simple sugar transport system permease protein